MKRHLFAFLLITLAGAYAGFSQSVTLNSTPSKAVGQPKLFPLSNITTYLAPNLVEGRELNFPFGLAIDTSVSPPIIYVSDFGNNRILAWKNATGFTNGQPADLIIGQTDPYSTAALGPGSTSPATGMFGPTGLAVDKNGNLYVADSGNNRILRFPQPFNQTSQRITPDLVLGQPSFSSRNPNYTGAVSATGISLASANGSSVLTAGIAIDASGNLWFTDAGNRRVLEYQASDIANGGQGIAAKIVLGQPDFTSQQTTLNSNSVQGPLTTNQFAIPAAVAFDNAGRLYVADSDNQSSSSSKINRVLVFDPSSSLGALANGRAADRIMGGGCLVFGTSCPALGSTVTSGGESGNNNFPFDTLMYDPEGIFFLPPDANGNQSVGVVDSGYNRILIFPAYSQWPAQSSLFSPEATTVIGQNGYSNSGPNGNSSTTIQTPPANSGTLWGPHAVAFLPATKELFVADSNNNRIIVLPQLSTASAGFGTATRVLGQDRLTSNSANLIEGKEFFFGSGHSIGEGGIALDSSGSVPHLYVADTGNHRVLGFYDARKIAPGQKADLVIGQPDGTTALCNYIGGATLLGGDGATLTNSSLCAPRDVLVDSSGNLYVADTGNGRVLRFPAPFGQCTGGPGSSNCTLPPLPQADLVLGQSNFSIKITDPSNTNMAGPVGLAFSGNNGLFVSDLADNRVLFIPFNDTTNHTFKPGSNGLAATVVYGQPDFISTGSGTADNQLNGPYHIASDTSGQLYVADINNNRVLIFPDPNNPLTPRAGAHSNIPGGLTCAVANNGSCATGLSSPHSVIVNPTTGEIWVANSGSSSCVRYPKYNTLIVNNAPTGGISSYGPLALAQDQYGDLFVADSANRVSVYYQGAIWQNGASFLSTPYISGLAPGSVGTLYPLATASQFGANTASFSGSFPMSTSLSDVQVLVDTGTSAQPVYTPAPLYLVSPGQINFIVPTNFSSPLPQTTDYEVVQQSTGQILGAGTLSLAPTAPGIFMGSQLAVSPAGYQAAVVNEDGSVNSQSNPAQRGHYISIYATGQGAVPGAPADGSVPGSLVSTPQVPQVLIGADFVDDYASQPGDPPPGQRVQFSGLSPSYPGVWQINVYIPLGVAPSSTSAPTPLDLEYNNVPAWNAGSPYRTYVWVK
jgi:uncharacterized protein (TIGR03437 family)